MSVIMSDRAARYYCKGQEKPVQSVGAIRVMRPDGCVVMRAFFRGLGASSEPYPHDQPDEE